MIGTLLGRGFISFALMFQLWVLMSIKPAVVVKYGEVELKIIEDEKRKR
jgi:hypothetical protein